jgi:hypothetical protein
MVRGSGRFVEVLDVTATTLGGPLAEGDRTSLTCILSGLTHLRQAVPGRRATADDGNAEASTCR